MKRLAHLLTRGGVLFITLVTILAPAAIALAQNPDAPPQPNIRRAPPVWLGYAVMFLLLAVVISISLMPSKRSHQD